MRAGKAKYKSLTRTFHFLMSSMILIGVSTGAAASEWVRVHEWGDADCAGGGEGR